MVKKMTDECKMGGKGRRLAEGRHTMNITKGRKHTAVACTLRNYLQRKQAPSYVYVQDMMECK